MFGRASHLQPSVVDDQRIAARNGHGAIHSPSGSRLGVRRLWRPRAAASYGAGAPEPWEALRHELARSRRYGGSFVVLSMAARDEAADADAVRSLVRGVDQVWVDQGRVLALLPESTRLLASGLVARIRAHAAWLTDDLRVVDFPGDAMTGAGLVAALRAPSPEGEPLSESQNGHDVAGILRVAGFADHPESSAAPNH